MTQVKEMTNPELNRKLAELMGWTVKSVNNYFILCKPNRELVTYEEVYAGYVGLRCNEDTAWEFVPAYCTDPAASLEVQAAAIAKNAEEYVRNLSIVKWNEDPLESEGDWDGVIISGVAELLIASPRERAEAAYITLSQVLKSQGADQLDL